MYKKKSHIHFVGIGGIGMSGIAFILAQRGYTVSGCDANLNQKNILDLQKIGCSIEKNHKNSVCKIKSVNILVYSTAISQNHPELITARAKNILCIHRSHMLAELMRTHHSIAIAGSHGKTTTSSLLSHLLIEAHYDPTVIIGGHLTSINSNARNGNGKYLVAEADESDRSLLRLFPSLAVITNIDLEHLETYTNLHDITNTFKCFLDRLPFYGKAIVCIENEQVRSLLPYNKATITYGLTNQADWYAQNIKHHPDYSTYNAYYKNTCMGTIHIAMPGIHNVLNSLATLAIGNEIEIPFTTIAQSLKTFTGVDRRFTFKGIYQGATVFDDYGHHPIEIQHTLESARRKTSGKIIMLFQPHRYTRTQKLWNEFVHMFASTSVDTLFITDIYEASETPLKGITSQELVKSIKKANPSLHVQYVPFTKNFSQLKQKISSTIKNGDLLLLQGAGKINTISAHLFNQ